jgi:hypothetical protein
MNRAAGANEAARGDLIMSSPLFFWLFRGGKPSSVIARLKLPNEGIFLPATSMLDRQLAFNHKSGNRLWGVGKRNLV